MYKRQPHIIFSIFNGLPETFEVARYHSLHGIKDHLPPELEVTALSEDGIVMGIQHNSLPFAAVQFHPESILTSPAHGMTILENALSNLRYEDDLSKKSGAEIVAKLEKMSVDQLQNRLASRNLSLKGSKSEMVVRLTLWTHKSVETKAGRLTLGDLSFEELEDLKAGLGIQTDATSKDELLGVLDSSLNQSHD